MAAARRSVVRPSSLARSIEQDGSRAIYILSGGSQNNVVDHVAVEKAIETLTETLLPDGADEWNLTILNADRITIAEMLDAARILPILSSRRLVMVRGVLEIAASEDDAGQRAEMAELKSLGAESSPPCSILLVEPPLDARYRVHKALVQASVLVDCSGPSPREMAAWIQTAAEREGLRFEGRSAEVLAAITGPDTARAGNEIEKLRLYAWERRPGSETAEIRIEDIAAVVGGGAQVDAWLLCDAVAALDERRALRLARNLLEAGEEPIALIGALAFRLRQMVQAADLHGSGHGMGDVLRKVRAWGTTRDVIAGNAARYDAEGLVGMLGVLLEADRARKTGGDGEEAVYAAVRRIVRRGRAV